MTLLDLHLDLMGAQPARCSSSLSTQLAFIFSAVGAGVALPGYLDHRF
jgi:hypothetical protein